MVRVDSIQTGGQAASGGGQDDVIKAWTAPLLASSIPTLVLTRDGAVLEANAALAEFFADAVGTEVGSFLDQDSAADLKRGLDALAGGGELALALELSGQVGEGLSGPLRADLLALRDREGVLLCVVAQFRENPGDVSDPAMMGMAAVMSAFDNFPLHMALLGPDLKPVKVHRALAQMLGYDENRILGDKAQDIVHPDDIGRVTAEVGRLLSGEADAVNFEIRNVIPSGQLRWMKVSIVANRDADGVANYFVAQGEDITEKKQMEETAGRREELERLITHFSANLVSLPSDMLEDSIRLSMLELAENTSLVRAVMFEFLEGKKVRVLHEWGSRGRGDVSMQGQELEVGDNRSFLDRMSRFEPYYVGDTREMNPDSQWWRDLFLKVGVRSLLVVPVGRSGRGKGRHAAHMAFGFSSPTAWTFDVVALFRVVAEIIIHALERGEAEDDLLRRVTLQDLVSRLATGFVDTSLEGIDDAINRALAEVSELIGCQGALIVRIDDSERGLSITHGWGSGQEGGDLGKFADLSMAMIPWTVAKLAKREVVSVSRVSAIPEEAAADRRFFEERSLKSILALPMILEGEVRGALGFVGSEVTVAWERDVDSLLMLVAELFSGALVRKRMDRELRDSEARFREVVENILEFFWVATADFSRLLYASPAYEQISGLPIEGIYKNFSASLEIIHSEDLPLVTDLLSRSQSIKEPLELSCRILRGGTELRWIRIRIVPVLGNDGEVDKLAGTVEDITVQKQSEQEARRHQDNLAHAQRLNTVGQMAVELAHEINQPLSAIVSFASGCQRRIRGGKVGVATLVKALDSISAQALRGAAIVKRLRGFVQREEPHLEGVDINDLVTESAGFIEAEVRERRINVSFDLDPAIPAVLADSVQVEQVVLNLLRNGLDAIESQPRGGGELIVRTARKGIDVVEVRVIDSGPGLGDADFEKVFDAFYTTKGGGLGMGLSISRSIIEAHGGRLWAESNSEAGMTFIFSLPAHIQRRDHGI